MNWFLFFFRSNCVILNATLKLKGKPFTNTVKTKCPVTFKKRKYVYIWIHV